MSVAGYPWCKGVNPDRKSWMEPRRQLDGIFVTFQLLLPPLWSSVILTLSCCWIRPARTREWGWLHANLLHFKQSQVHIINQPLSHPITSSLVVTGEQRSDRCGYTGSYSHRPAHRQLRLYSHSLLTRTEVMFGSVWAALNRTALLIPTVWGTG